MLPPPATFGLILTLEEYEHIFHDFIVLNMET